MSITKLYLQGSCMKKSELLLTAENNIISKYETVMGKANFVDFLMRYIVDEFMKIQKIPLLKGTIKKDTGVVKPFIIKNPWDKNCTLEEIQEQIMDSFRLSEPNKKDLILSREIRNKLFHGDFFGVAQLLGMQVKDLEILSKTNDRLERLMALDSMPHLLSKCEVLFDKNKTFLTNLVDHHLLQKNNI